ncbi:type II toxin-antitoxin system PemK/MazF family toxin [Clostridium perfringens]|nr:type II toxin-antitoxin system PemK/MazF family toxin [Clostridium perfringens]
MNILRGDIFYADLSPVVGLEQGGIRPVVILQNNIGNRHSPTVIAAPITSTLNKPKLPTHVGIETEDSNLNIYGVLILEQVRVLDRSRLREKVSNLGEKYNNEINKALAITLSLHDKTFNNTNELDIEEITTAINILKKLAEKSKLNLEVEEDSKFTESLKKMYKEMNTLNEKFDRQMKQFLRKTSIKKGLLAEQAVIDYFNKIKKPRHDENAEDYLYEAEKADSTLDHLKIDVIAKNSKNKIFIQVKAGKIKSGKLEESIKSISELDDKIYNKENLKKIACICANTFPQDIEFQRLALEEKYDIKIMLIHQYQILELPECKHFKKSLQ